MSKPTVARPGPDDGSAAHGYDPRTPRFERTRQSQYVAHTPVTAALTPPK